MPLTYSSYLQLDELLSLQRPRSDGPEHDELLFIIVHQVYELWFKEMLHELDYIMERLEAGDTPPVLHTMKRVLTILKVLVAQLDILETMTPLDFLSFRERLESGSGFQSCQFRELEFVLGLKDVQAIARFPEGSPERRRLDSRYRNPSLWLTFLRYLSNNEYDMPAEALAADPTEPTEPSQLVQQQLIDIYRNDPATTQLCERLVDLDEGIQEWRYRHVKMVQRTIGTKRGTGGSDGAAYLKTTLFKPAFPDLWAIRTEL
ncbi:MAG: tryptophan 2,3-dioxygenase [Gemmatimonadales bacterium]